MVGQINGQVLVGRVRLDAVLSVGLATLLVATTALLLTVSGVFGRVGLQSIVAGFFVQASGTWPTAGPANATLSRSWASAMFSSRPHRWSFKVGNYRRHSPRATRRHVSLVEDLREDWPQLRVVGVFSLPDGCRGVRRLIRSPSRWASSRGILNRGAIQFGVLPNFRDGRNNITLKEKR